MLYKAPLVLWLHTLLFLYHEKARGNIILSEKDPGFQPADGIIFCSEEDVYFEHYGTFKFPKTKATQAGVEVKVPCNYGFRYDGIECFADEQPETKEIKMAKSGATRTCFLNPDINGTMVGQWHNETVVIYCKEVGRDDVFANWISNVNTVIVSENIELLFNKYNEVNLYLRQGDHEFAAAVINGIDSILRNPALGPDVLTTRQINHILAVMNGFINLEELLRPGCKSKVGDNGIIVETAMFHGANTQTEKDVNANIEIPVQPYVTSFTILETTSVGINIPSEALRISMKNANKTHPVLKITAYSQDIFRNHSEDNLSVSMSDTCETFDNDCETNNNCCKHAFKSWGNLSIELDGTINNLIQPIEFSIVNPELTPGCNVTCVYMNSEGEFYTDGLQTIQLENGVKCTSSHLTVFSALIEPLPLPFPNAEYAPINNSIHSHILSILSSIGSVCSIIGLCFTLLTYGLFRSLRKERSNRILINLSSSLLLMHIMSISGSKTFWDGHCLVPAASLHYLVLTSLAWMMVEAVHMFELLISVFVRPENRFLIKRFLLAWGIPLVVVIVCTIMEPNVYEAGRADLCLMSAHANIILYYVAYIGPICAMLLVNIVIFVRIFRVLYQQTKRTNGVSHKGQKSSPRYHFVKISPSQIKGATTVMVLLGIGWVLGLLAIGPFEVFFRYMYCVCNAGQGLLIFIFRVVLHPHASKQWKKTILGLSPDSSLDSSVTFSVSASGNGKKRKSTMVSPTFISASNSVENSLTASNPLSTNLAATLASILRSEAAKAATSGSNVENEM